MSEELNEIPEWKRKALAVLNICKPEYKWIAMDENGMWNVFNSQPYMYVSASNNDLKWKGGNRKKIPLCFDIPIHENVGTAIVERSE